MLDTIYGLNKDGLDGRFLDRFDNAKFQIERKRGIKTIW